MTVTTEEAGFLRVLESYDPGWSATVDGVSVDVLPADEFLMAVPIRPGAHEVRFVFRTPGAKTGVAISLASLVLLAGLMLIARGGRAGCHPEGQPEEAPRPT